MLLLFIFLGTLVSGVGSVLLAALMSPRQSSRMAPDMLSFAAGALLSTACLHLLPEALEGSADARPICTALLAGLVVFFALDKLEMWHHGHEHHHGPAHAQPAVQHPQGGWAGGVWSLLLGDSVHCFGDGLLIAAAFMADMRLGALASLAVLTHEVPHHLGDLAVVRRSANGRQRAAAKVAIAGAVTVIGGLAGYWVVEALRQWMPYFLVMAASSFVYVALSDLIPQMQTQAEPKSHPRQIFWLGAGILIVALATRFDVA